MSRPRYSIIPGGASTDPSLEGNDLRVLCFLGEHTNKLGWCFLSQGRIADALHIGRATVQRSLARLVAAGYVQIKASVVSGRPHACHAYRVIMDRDDPEIEPSESEVEDQDRERGCPPACTPGAQPERAPVPAIDGHGVPTHTRAQKDQDSPQEVVGDARARGSSGLSGEAFDLATQLAGIAGHDPQFLPPRWMSDGPVARVQQMLDHGWQPQMMIETAQAVMRVKSDGSPATIKYFERPFAEAHARQSKPSPLPTCNPEVRTHERSPSTTGASDWKTSRDNWRRGAAEFSAAVDALDGSPGARGQGSEAID